MKKKVYRAKVQRISDLYPMGYLLVLLMAGPPPVPPKDLPDAEVEANLASLEDVCIRFERRMAGA